MASVAQNNIVWEVYDNFQKQTYRNRYHICTDQGLHKLSVPIKHIGGKDGRQKYRNVRIDNSYRWQQQHWRTLQTAYRTSPFFEYYEDELEPLFMKPITFLLDFKWATIEFLTTALQLEYEKVFTSAYSKVASVEMDKRNLVNAKKLVEIDFMTYNQVFIDRHGFVPNTSTLDLLFNEGPNALGYLQKLVLS